ncbi:hypothetical protein CJF42_04460 [Pseudoalteromonas sp. NBT06-2]|uniref:MipA/OmpV family protein n=1 Tax=Pseudoalteromonas sp. NBT06-2 TaxID=2025950 RepID=UPI000BA6642A|nr:MipA/OmpV family protein [Pseudoalteromonas sp. NBT06-2]PAJ75578.1 hypothetical protein CJF42_04460 [Pseudoalteromonas sp. NBT06-2]
MLKGLSIKTLLKILCLTIWLSPIVTHASNRLYADNDLEPIKGFSWDWSFGAGIYIQDSYLLGSDSTENGKNLNLNLALSYNNFYLDIDNSQLSGKGALIIGYSVIDKYDWGLDIIASNFQSGFDENGIYNTNDLIPELEGITPREYDFDAGIRLSRSYKDTQLSFELLNDISGAHGGWLFNTYLSHIRVWKNWEFRSVAGLNFYSENFTQYYYGITPKEAKSDRTLYSPGNSYSVLIEFHAEYPLTEDWVFMGGILSTKFSSAIGSSPIISQSYQHKAKVGVRYVF